MFSDRLYFLADKDEYQEQRQFVVPMFKGPQLCAYIPMMLEEVERLMSTFGDEGELELVHTCGTGVMNIAIAAFSGATSASASTVYSAPWSRCTTASRPCSPRPQTAGLPPRR